MTKFKIYEHIFNSYINDNKELDTKIKLIDSSFIPNNSANINHELIGRNSYYNNKYGTKVTIISNENGFPLYMQVNSGNKHDATIGAFLIEHIGNKLNGSLLLADTGYDSNKFKSSLKNNGCEHIIPKNMRNKMDDTLKNTITTEIKQIKNKTKNRRNKISNQIIKLKKDRTLKNKDKIRKLKKEKKNLAQDEKNKISEIKKLLRLKFKKNKNKKKRQLNIGINDEQKKVYKNRTKVEHIFNFIKKHGFEKVKSKSIKSIKSDIYRTFIDKIMYQK